MFALLHNRAAWNTAVFDARDSSMARCQHAEPNGHANRPQLPEVSMECLQSGGARWIDDAAGPIKVVGKINFRPRMVADGDGVERPDADEMIDGLGQPESAKPGAFPLREDFKDRVSGAGA